MVIPFHVTEMLRRVMARYDADKTPRQMAPNDDAFDTLRPTRKITDRTIASYWARLRGLSSQAAQDQIADPATVAAGEAYSANIENFIGTVKDRKSVV